MPSPLLIFLCAGNFWSFANCNLFVIPDLTNTPYIVVSRLKLPKGGMGREYVVIQLYIQNTGPYDFMVDSGLTTELITPHLQQALHLPNTGVTNQGLSAGRTDQTQSLVELKDVSLCCSGDSRERFALPNLTAIVTEFPQEHIDPAHDPVEGMLGMEVSEQLNNICSNIAILLLIINRFLFPILTWSCRCWSNLMWILTFQKAD